jgi:hypothetical protein
MTWFRVVGSIITIATTTSLESFPTSLLPLRTFSFAGLPLRTFTTFALGFPTLIPLVTTLALRQMLGSYRQRSRRLQGLIVLVLRFCTLL